MDKKYVISFYWQGFSGRYGQWKDGLWSAMKEIEKQHKVYYLDTTDDCPADTNIVLYWEAPVTILGKDRENYLKVINVPYPKILLFAGGQIKTEWVDKFEMLLLESQINEKECEELGIKYMRAFGVNTYIMKPERQPKIFDAVFPSTCAGWKRQGLFSRALGSRGVICGRFQESDPIGFLNARENNTLVLPEISQEAVASLYNASHCCVNTSEFWGGGQRTTLEAMACGIPVIVMADSPKNIEYVEESGAGIVVEPNEDAIRKGIEEIKMWTPEQKAKGRAYVESKWTTRHYADNILKAIQDVLK